MVADEGRDCGQPEPLRGTARGGTGSDARLCRGNCLMVWPITPQAVISREEARPGRYDTARP
jgi:hypothetical protein